MKLKNTWPEIIKNQRLNQDYKKITDTKNLRNRF